MGVSLMADRNEVCARVFVSGRVQGVFFRVFVRKHAVESGIRGYVRNLMDGRVEAVFQGSPDKVQKMIRHVHTGPRLARVDDVSVQWEDGLQDLDMIFQIRY
jgi:acylphosphatase